VSHYPADPPVINRKPPTGPIRLEHRLCGYVVTLPAETRLALRWHPEQLGIFCDGCARMLQGTEFDLVEEPTKKT
jgi:hypothetical protein